MKGCVFLMELNLTGRPVGGHGAPDDFATLSAVLIDGEHIFIDNGAIHGKSRVERGVDFRSATSPEQVPGARRIALVWVMLARFEGGMGYNGVTAAEIFVDEEKKVGYKSMAALVNQMDGAMKGKVDLARLSEEEKKRLAKFMEELRPDLWGNMPEEKKELFG
jgi:hypothetical protein